MQSADHESLSERIEAVGRLNAAAACRVALGVLAELALVHDTGRMHGQLTASQVRLSRPGLGPERVTLSESLPATASRLGEAVRGTVATAHYWAPEQAKGARDLDRRTDLYAVGVVLYEALTGRTPFDAATFDELLYKIVLEEPPRVAMAAPELDPGLAVIVDKARAKDPGQRFQTVREFQEALRSWASRVHVDLEVRAPVDASAGEPNESRPRDAAPLLPANRRLWLLIAVVVVLLGIAFAALR